MTDETDGPDILPVGFAPITTVTHAKHIGRFSTGRSFKFYLPTDCTHQELMEIIKAFADIAMKLVTEAEAEARATQRIVLPS